MRRGGGPRPAILFPRPREIVRFTAILTAFTGLEPELDTGAVILLAGAGLVLLAIAGVAASARLGAPLLLVFLFLGMLAGEDGPGGVSFSDYNLAFILGSAALALILFDGGLGTRARLLRATLRPALSLATLGVILTAALTGVAAKYLFGIGWVEALLIGAIVGSTDAAAVLMLVAGRRMKARPRVATTLEAESGLNDPVAVIMVVILVEWLLRGAPPAPWTAALEIGWALAAGAGIGLLGGRAIAFAETRIGLPIGLYPIFAAAAAVFLFAFAQSIQASGFLAAYLAGVVFAATPHRAAAATERFMDGLAWLAQIGLFLMLGLLVTPSHALAVALPAAGVALALVFIARPIAVLISLAPFKFRMNERAFIAWMGLRGAVPIFLGAYPVLAGVENANLYFSAAFAVVTISLVMQGWTAGPAARLFGVAPPRAPDEDRFAALRGAGLGFAGLFALAAVVWLAAGLLEPRERPLQAVAGTVQVLEERIAEGPAGAPLALEALPADWRDISDPHERQQLFARAVAGLMAAENARIEADRRSLETLLTTAARRPLSLREQAERDRLARQYGGRYEDVDDLLARIDVVPPSLAVAQAALATGWGSSPAAVERNALFGRGMRFANLSASAADYARVLNSHPDFAGFRVARAVLRAEGRALSGAALAPHVAPYAASGEDYAARVALLIAVNDLARFDPRAAIEEPAG